VAPAAISPALVFAFARIAGIPGVRAVSIGDGLRQTLTTESAVQPTMPPGSRPPSESSSEVAGMAKPVPPAKSKLRLPRTPRGGLDRIS
jgi:hypothetical protein